LNRQRGGGVGEKKRVGNQRDTWEQKAEPRKKVRDPTNKRSAEMMGTHAPRKKLKEKDESPSCISEK